METRSVFKASSDRNFSRYGEAHGTDEHFTLYALLLVQWFSELD